jgi:hypothetical protein
MNRRVLVGVALVLVALLAAAAIGTSAYRAGVIRGLADAGKLPASAVGGMPMPYYGYYGPFWHHGPFGFLGFLFPLLGLLLIFGLFRALFWRPWCGGPHSVSKRNAPPWFEEWHRRAHESMPERGQSP